MVQRRIRVIGDVSRSPGGVGLGHLGEVAHCIGLEGFPLTGGVGGGYCVAGVCVSGGAGAVGLLDLQGAAKGVVDVFGPVDGGGSGGVRERGFPEYAEGRTGAGRVLGWATLEGRPGEWPAPLCPM